MLQLNLISEVKKYTQRGDVCVKSMIKSIVNQDASIKMDNESSLRVIYLLFLLVLV